MNSWWNWNCWSWFKLFVCDLFILLLIWIFSISFWIEFNKYLFELLKISFFFNFLLFLLLFPFEFEKHFKIEEIELSFEFLFCQFIIKIVSSGKFIVCWELIVLIYSWVSIIILSMLSFIVESNIVFAISLFIFFFSFF